MVKKLLQFIFLLLLFNFTIFAQASNKENVNLQLWRLRAETITNNLLKNQNQLKALDKAYLLARLGDLWWQTDKTQANSYFEKSVGTLSFYTFKSDAEEDKKFLPTARKVLLLVGNRNPKQAKRLTEILSETENLEPANKDDNAEAIIDFALQIVKAEPQKALELGNLAFKIAQPDNFYKLYWELRRNSPAAADKFFKTAFLSALASPNPQIVSNLKYAVFPEIAFPEPKAEILSPNPIKIETLNFFADYVHQQQTKFTFKTIPSCEAEASVVAPLKSQFTLLLPQKTQVIEQAVSVCLAAQSQANQNLVTSGIAAGVKNNIEELLSLADEAKDEPKLRNYYLMRAASIANDQKKYKIAVDILDGMSKEERAIDAEYWEDLRVTVAAGFAYQQFQEQNTGGAIRALEAVDTESRAFAKVGFALKISPKDLSAREFSLEKIREARADFIKSEKPFAQKAGYWLQIIKLYSNYQLYSEASETFREIVKAFNNSLSDDKAQIYDGFERVNSVISVSLLETQDNQILESVNLLKDDSSRMKAGFALLKLSLKEYETLKQAVPKAKPANSQPQGV
jgi:hypothetical protein